MDDSARNRRTEHARCCGVWVGNMVEEEVGGRRGGERGFYPRWGGRPSIEVYVPYSGYSMQ